MKNAFKVLAALLISSLIGASAAAGEAVAAESLKEIYSNFNTDSSESLYDCCAAFTVSAPASETGLRVTVAMPFTPADNGSIRKIRLALSHRAGSNSLGVSLRADAGGVPGAVIKRFEVSDLAEFGSCCETAAVAPGGIPIIGGTPYWLVVKADADTSAVWNFNTTDVVGQYAANLGKGWELFSNTLGAFKVLGD